jgi:hypothetical protein
VTYPMLARDRKRATAKCDHVYRPEEQLGALRCACANAILDERRMVSFSWVEIIRPSVFHSQLGVGRRGGASSWLQPPRWCHRSC